MSTRLLASVLLATLAACGGTTDPAELAREGVAALNAKDYGPAHSALRKAVEGLPADHPRALEARVALCRTLAHGRPEQCVDRLADLARERDDLELADAALVVRELIRAEEFASVAPAVKVSEGRFGKRDELALLVDEALAEARKADRPDSVKALEDLGYTAGKD